MNKKNQISRKRQILILKQKVTDLIQKFDKISLEEATQFLSEAEVFCDWSEGKLHLAFMEDLFQDFEEAIYSVKRGEEEPKYLLLLLKTMLKRVNLKEQEIDDQKDEPELNIKKLEHVSVVQIARKKDELTDANRKTTKDSTTASPRDYASDKEYLVEYKEIFLNIAHELQEKFDTEILIRLRGSLSLAGIYAGLFKLNDLDEFLNCVRMYVNRVINYEVTRQELFIMLECVDKRMAREIELVSEGEEERKNKERLSKFMQECVMKLDFDQFDLNEDDVVNVMNALASICSFIVSKKKN